MANKTTIPEMIQFIESNKQIYQGKMDIENLSNMTEEEIQKLHRNIKNKLWQINHRKPRTMAERIEAITLYDECENLRTELNSYLAMIDQKMADLKSQKIESLKSLINDSKAQLKELQG